MKKINFFTHLSLIPVILCSAGCNQNNKKYEQVGMYINVYGVEEHTKSFPYNFDLKDYLNINGKINKDIAKMAMLFSANLASGAAVEFQKADYEIDAKNQNNFYQYLDLDDFESIYIGLDENDICDETNINIAHKKINENKKDYEIIFLTIQDSNQGPSWYSNFDIGVNNDSYFSKTGEHNEWINYDNHKGFDITANRCFEALNNYTKNQNLENSSRIYYVFGHSRGGAIANILSAKMIDLDYEVCSYTMASPSTTTSKNAKDAKYNNIHNFVCSEDIVCNSLRPSWGFDRYGETISFSIKLLADQFKKYNEFVLPKGDTSNIVKIFERLTDSRENIYEFNDKFLVDQVDSIAKVDVDTHLNRFTAPLVDEFTLLNKFINVDINEINEDNVSIKITTCPGFYLVFISTIILQGLSDISTITRFISSFSPYLDTLKSVTGYKITDLLNLNLLYLVDVHYYPTYVTYFNNM